MYVYSGIVPKELDLIPSKERNRRVLSCQCSELENLHASTFPACYSLSPFHARLGSSVLSWGELPLAAGLLCVLCLQNRAQKYGIRRSGGFCTVQPLNHTSVSMWWVQYMLPKTAAPSYLVLNLSLKIKSSHPCTNPVVGSHAGVVTLDHSVILIVQHEHRTLCCILRMISVPSGISVGQKLL